MWGLFLYLNLGPWILRHTLQAERPQRLPNNLTQSCVTKVRLSKACLRWSGSIAFATDVEDTKPPCTSAFPQTWLYRHHVPAHLLRWLFAAQWWPLKEIGVLPKTWTHICYWTTALMKSLSKCHTKHRKLQGSSHTKKEWNQREGEIPASFNGRAASVCQLMKIFLMKATHCSLFSGFLSRVCCRDTNLNPHRFHILQTLAWFFEG